MNGGNIRIWEELERTSPIKKKKKGLGKRGIIRIGMDQDSSVFMFADWSIFQCKIDKAEPVTLQFFFF